MGVCASALAVVICAPAHLMLGAKAPARQVCLMARHLVIGSGASGVHYALTVLERGEEVTLLDVGYERPIAPLPDATSTQLKEQLEDPLSDILGERSEYVVYPGPVSKPYGFPPSKGYVFRQPAAWSLTSRGFDPLVSFARGGLAEAWTGGSYELDERDLAAFPFSLGDLQPHYATVARRIGIAAERDDLERFSPMTAGYDAPLPLDAHSAELLGAYARKRQRVNALGVYLGRSRVAVLTKSLGERGACTQLGRCLMGCPRQSLYAPSYTLRELHRFPGFTYVPGVFVERILLDGNGKATGVVARELVAGADKSFTGDRVVLAAGALASSRIYLSTLQHETGAAPELPGLMDNRHVMMPFVTPSRVGNDVEIASYQFHHLALGMRGTSSGDDVHGQITALKGAQVHPIVSSLPFDFRTSLSVFGRVRAALGIANFWLADTRRDANVAHLRVTDDARHQPRAQLRRRRVRSGSHKPSDRGNTRLAEDHWSDCAKIADSCLTARIERALRGHVADDDRRAKTYVSRRMVQCAVLSV